MTHRCHLGGKQDPSGIKRAKSHRDAVLSDLVAPCLAKAKMGWFFTKRAPRKVRKFSKFPQPAIGRKLLGVKQKMEFFAHSGPLS